MLVAKEHKFTTIYTEEKLNFENTCKPYVPAPQYVESLQNIFVTSDDGVRDPTVLLSECLKQFHENSVMEVGFGQKGEEFMSILTIMPNNAPLVDHIRVRIDSLPWWQPYLNEVVNQVAETRAFNVDTPDTYEVREICVGNTSLEEVDQWLQWMFEKQQEMFARFPSWFAAHVSKLKVIKLPTENPSHKILGSTFMDAEPGTTGDDYALPAMLTIGGDNFAGIIKLPWVTSARDGVNTYVYDDSQDIQLGLKNYLMETILVL